MERNRQKNKVSRWWIFPTVYTHTRWIPYIHKDFTGSSLLNISNKIIYKNVSVWLQWRIEKNINFETLVSAKQKLLTRSSSLKNLWSLEDEN